MSISLYLKFKFSPDVKCNTTELLILWDLAQLADINNTVYPSMSTMAKWYQLSESATRRAVHSLIKKGHIEVIGNDKGGAGSRRYRLIEPAKYDAEALTPSVYDTPTPSVDATPNLDGTPSVDATPPLAYTHVTPSVDATQVVNRSKREVNLSAQCADDENPQIKNQSAKASKAPTTAKPSIKAEEAESPKRVRHDGGVKASEAFNKFWDAFPDHRHKGSRVEAEKVWMRKNFDPILDRIIADIEKQQRCNADWKEDKKGLTFIKAGHRYLNDLEVDALPNPNEPFARRTNSMGDEEVWHMRPKDYSIYCTPYGKTDPDDWLICPDLSLWQSDKAAQHGYSKVLLDIDMAEVWARHLAIQAAKKA